MILQEKERIPGSCLFNHIEENNWLCFVRACWEPWAVVVITLHHCFSAFFFFLILSVYLLKLLIQLVSSIFLYDDVWERDKQLLQLIFRPPEPNLAPLRMHVLHFVSL